MCGFLRIFRAFPVCALCSGVFSFLQSLPPQPFLRSNSSRCSNASSMLSLCVSSVQLYPSFLSRYLLLFTAFAPSLFIFPLCTPPDTCPIFSLCVFRPGTSFSLLSFLPFLSPSLGFPFPLCFFCVFFARVFRLGAPHLPGAIPSLPASFPSSSSFVPAFSFPFSPFFSSPSFSIKKKVFP